MADRKRLYNAKNNIKKDNDLRDDQKVELLESITKDNIDEIIMKKRHMTLENIDFICLYCGEKFIPNLNIKNFKMQKFCCIKHQETYLNRSRSEYHVGDTKQCIECGKDFVITNGKHKLCPECSKDSKKIYMKRYKEILKSKKPPKEPKPSKIKIPKEKIVKEKVVRIKKVLTEEEIAKKKLITNFKRRQTKIDGMDNFFKACTLQLKLNEDIKLHFPEGLEGVL